MDAYEYAFVCFQHQFYFIISAIIKQIFHQETKWRNYNAYHYSFFNLWDNYMYFFKQQLLSREMNRRFQLSIHGYFQYLDTLSEILIPDPYLDTIWGPVYWPW